MANNYFDFEIISSDGKKENLKIDGIYINIPSNGVRGLLKGHVDFVAVLNVSILYCIKDNVKKYYAISGGIFSFKNNKATMLADTFEAREEIDKDRAIFEKNKAEEILKKEKEDQNIIESAEFSLKKAINRLSIL